jgi:hypothetical protein
MSCKAAVYITHCFRDSLSPMKTNDFQLSLEDLFTQIVA